MKIYMLLAKIPQTVFIFVCLAYISNASETNKDSFIKDKILDKIDDITKRKKPPKFVWKDSTYEDIKYRLSLDDRGQIGEELLADVFIDENRFVVDYQKNITSTDKGYDIIINNKKIEVKTATITTNSGNFQHEHLQIDRDFDMIFFVDIAPNQVFLTAVKKADVIWSKKRTDSKKKRPLHRRPNGDYKCDFTIKHITNNDIPKFRKFVTGEIKTKKSMINIVQKALEL
ncbi:MAG: hypothetical protein DRG11_05355 [Epsilonproteobacteria bacterium]|nr:MAG: hypothetical protein DRG11_05355 [Campylobacterota bacterium]